MHPPGAESLSARLLARVHSAIAEAGGWLPFDRYMALVLYEPGLGYYARDSRQFGHGPGSGSDFVTAPELSPLFGQTLAVQVAQALDAAGAGTVYEFGAGSGALAEQLLDALGERVQRYAIVDVSGSLRARQRERLARFGARVEWLDAWPAAMEGVVVGNEVLDAMPVQLLRWDGERWHERGVVAAEAGDAGAIALAWEDRPTPLAPPHPGPYRAGTVTEIHPQAEAFVRTLAERLHRGAAFFIDYGFPEAEYYHVQRDAGTLACHRGHRVELAEGSPLADPGDKDITAHVNFSAVALAAQDAGFDIVGYTSQANVLLNCGIAERMVQADARGRSAAHLLIAEHEMGELFKVLALARGIALHEPVGFVRGDRSHTL
jgi:SAM-dependent MidA family methyltransferase